MSPKVWEEPVQSILADVGMASTVPGALGGESLCVLEAVSAPCLVSAYLWPPRCQGLYITKSHGGEGRRKMTAKSCGRKEK